MANGVLNATGGIVDVNSGRLTIAQGSQITEDVQSIIKENGVLSVDGGNVYLGQNTDWKGAVTVTDGNLDISGLSSNGVIQAIGGNLNIKDGSLEVGKNSVIAGDVSTNINNDANINITDGGGVQIDNNDTWNGKISLNGGTLNYNTKHSGKLEANSGNFNLLTGSMFSFVDNSEVKNEVNVNIPKGATVDIQSGSLNLDAQDRCKRLINVFDGGNLKTVGLSNNTSAGGALRQTGGSSVFTDKSNISITDEGSYIIGGNVSILNNSSLSLGADVYEFLADNLAMANNSALNIMNNVLDEPEIHSNMTVNGKNNVSIDVAPRYGVSDKFAIDKLTSESNGTLNISDFNFVGLAPIDRHIKFKVFDANSIQNVTFDTTDKEIFTPIGWYDIQSAGGGYFTSNLTHYNPQVFRGQVATLAMYNNQLAIDDMLLNHVTLDSERYLAQSNANKYAATLPQFAPYQYKREDGGLWFKQYVNFENLSLTQGLRVGNNSYGSLIGADFPVVNLKNGWKFLPTAYIGYNGSHQTFDYVGMYQNGGQGGFMGTFMKDDFIGSVLAYGGGYVNEMSVAGYNDTTGNWFAGTAAKLAYNFHPTKHFTIQPTAFISYNIFGKQNWGTDFGSMSMNSGLLNGINVAPGVNFIYARETWSVYATVQYMYNINDQVGGRAGNVNLASVEMEHGYIQYGFGATKTWKDRLNSFFQIVFRNGGRTGVGFQLGLQYIFDWANPVKKSKAAAPKDLQSSSSGKKLIKSLSMK